MCHGVRFLWSTSSSQVLQPIHMCKQNNNRKNRIISRILPDMICEITGIQLRLSSKYDVNLVMHPLRNIECPVFLCVIHQETPDEVACECLWLLLDKKAFASSSCFWQEQKYNWNWFKYDSIVEFISVREGSNTVCLSAVIGFATRRHYGMLPALQRGHPSPCPCLVTRED